MSNHQTNHISDLLPGYVLGALDPAELKAVENHLVGCSACQAEAAELQETVGYLALAAPEVELPPSLKGQLQARIASVHHNGSTAHPALPLQAPPAPTRAPWWQRLGLRRPQWQWAAAALALVLIISNLLWWQTFNQLQAPSQPGEFMAVSLSATDTVPQAAGFLMVSHDGLSGAIVVDELPILGKNHQYQLWLIRDGEYESGAVLSVDELGYGGSRVQPPQSLFVYDSVGITIEPAGGSRQPTGAWVLRQSLFEP